MFNLFDAINIRMSIAGRMRLLGMMMVVPVAITGWLLYQSHMETINSPAANMPARNIWAPCGPT